MRVGLLYADTAGCGTYRCLLPAHEASRRGFDVMLSDKLYGKRDDHGRLVGVGELNVDVLVYQRPLRADLVDTIPLVQAAGVRVIVEIDDDLERTHPANQAYRFMDPKTSPGSNWKHMRRAVQLADYVTVSTDQLAARYGEPGRVSVVRNYVPDGYCDLGRMPLAREDGGELPDQLRIGWGGQVASHPTDLQECGAAVQTVMGTTGAAFRVIGNAEGVAQAIGVRRGQFEATGWVEMTKYPAAVATLDVGLVPLADTEFNRAKSWLKGLEFAAVGVPFIASAVPEYVRLHEEYGLGLIARSKRDWLRHLSRLAADPELRVELSIAGRRTVRDRLTIEQRGQEWIDAWTEASQVEPKTIREAALSGVSS